MIDAVDTKKLSNCMHIALISDVHGNLPALEAVLRDARERGVEHFLLLGDYITDFPYPNEVAELLQSLENATLIRGNKEERFAWLYATNDASLYAAQMSATRWSLETLTDTNREYLCVLPDNAKFEFGGQRLFATHSSREICRPLAKLDVMHSSWYAREMERTSFTHAQYLIKAQQEIFGSSEVSAELAELPAGVYAFGHNHLQGHWRIGDVLLVNPGSCGLPLDFDTCAPYTILTVENGKISVEEHRAQYDIEAVVEYAKHSAMYAAAPEWCEIHAHIIRTGQDYVGAFLEYANKLSVQRNAAVEKNAFTPKGVVSDDVWREAWDTWNVRRGW